MSDLHRETAAKCNNAAWELIETFELSAEQKAELMALAGTAYHHWREIGNAGQIAHAELLFGWACARCGAWEAAQTLSARANLVLGDGETWERAFALAASAAAAWSAGSTVMFASLLQEAESLGATLTGPDAKYFAAAFASLPVPPKLPTPQSLEARLYDTLVPGDPQIKIAKLVSDAIIGTALESDRTTIDRLVWVDTREHRIEKSVVDDAIALLIARTDVQAFGMVENWRYSEVIRLRTES